MNAQIFARFNGNKPADANTIDRIQREFGINLPPEYIEFLEYMDGGEGFIGPNYVIFWRAEELKAMNDAYEVSRQVPNLFLFGSDGGDEGFAFTTQNARKFVAIPLLGMDRALARVCGNSFNEFL